MRNATILLGDENTYIVEGILLLLKLQVYCESNATCAFSEEGYLEIKGTQSSLTMQHVTFIITRFHEVSLAFTAAYKV